MESNFKSAAIHGIMFQDKPLILWVSVLTSVFKLISSSNRFICTDVHEKIPEQEFLLSWNNFLNRIFPQYRIFKIQSLQTNINICNNTIRNYFHMPEKEIKVLIVLKS